MCLLYRRGGGLQTRSVSTDTSAAAGFKTTPVFEEIGKLFEKVRDHFV